VIDHTLKRNKAQVNQPAALLDVATKLDRTVTATWRPTVREHSVTVRREPKVLVEDPEPPVVDRERSKREAQKRATKNVRRWCVHAKLDRLLTVTFAEKTTTDDRATVARTLAGFFRRLKARYPGLHYLYVLEEHPGGHGYHSHAAVNMWLDPVVVRECWGHGFIDIRRIKTKGRGTLLEQSRMAGRYIAKYATKSEDAGRHMGGHRYERSQGEPIPEVRIECDSWAAAEAWLRGKLRGAVVWQWASDDDDDAWKGPRTLVLWE
jgi:hypothetical protein